MSWSKIMCENSSSLFFLGKMVDSRMNPGTLVGKVKLNSLGRLIWAWCVLYLKPWRTKKFTKSYTEWFLNVLQPRPQGAFLWLWRWGPISKAREIEHYPRQKNKKLKLELETKNPSSLQTCWWAFKWSGMSQHLIKAKNWSCHFWRTRL